MQEVVRHGLTLLLQNDGSRITRVEECDRKLESFDELNFGHAFRPRVNVILTTGINLKSLFTKIFNAGRLKSYEDG